MQLLLCFGIGQVSISETNRVIEVQYCFFRILLYDWRKICLKSDFFHPPQETIARRRIVTICEDQKEQKSIPSAHHVSSEKWIINFLFIYLREFMHWIEYLQVLATAKRQQKEIYGDSCWIWHPQANEVVAWKYQRKFWESKHASIFQRSLVRLKYLLLRTAAQIHKLKLRILFILTYSIRACSDPQQLS